MQPFHQHSNTLLILFPKGLQRGIRRQGRVAHDDCRTEIHSTLYELLVQVLPFPLDQSLHSYYILRIALSCINPILYNFMSGKHSLSVAHSRQQDANNTGITRLFESFKG